MQRRHSGHVYKSICGHESMKTFVAEIPLFFLAIFLLSGCLPSGEQFAIKPTDALPTEAIATVAKPTSTPRTEITPSPFITLTAPIINPSPSASEDPPCNPIMGTEPSNGWDCLSERHGFTIHFPAESGIFHTTDNLVDVSLHKSAPDPRIDRVIEIFTGEKAEACFSPDTEKVHIGKYDFSVKSDEEPSGVIYAWKSYAISKGTQSVCFFFIAEYQTFPEDAPPVPPEKDQGLADVEAILATFLWLVP